MPRRPSADASNAPPPPRPTNGGDKGQLTRIKVLTIGAQEVGKSCIVKRYCEGRFIQK